MDHSHTHKYKYKFAANDFLKWSTNTLREIEVGAPVKKPKVQATEMCWKKLKIPLVYVQLIDQLHQEDKHGDEDSRHESLRRQSYARRVLDAVGKELRRYSGSGVSFRSKVLNPILQRYLRGVPDSYTPSVRAAISIDSNPTFADASAFYLIRDPVDKAWIPHYRRNLVYIAESRWHLGYLLKTMAIGDTSDFDMVRNNHDKVMGALGEENDEDDEDEAEDVNIDNIEDEYEPKAFSEAEIRIIVEEGLEKFFKKELEATEATVSTLYHFLPLSLISQNHRPNFTRQSGPSFRMSEHYEYHEPLPLALIRTVLHSITTLSKQFHF